MNSRPLVMCLTNAVAADITANVLLAIGAKPAMIEEPSEAAELAKAADAVLVNLGTVHPRQAATMRAALSAIGNTPWVLDPVACHQLAYRGKLAAEFIAKKPTLIRGNHAEIDFLRKTIPGSVASVPMLSTGEVDKIYPSGPTTGNSQPTTVSGGVPMLQLVTATGCAQGAICAAMLGRGMAPVEAAVAASRLMKRAGERAWERTKAPGSFKVALVDALWEEVGLAGTLGSRWERQ